MQKSLQNMQARTGMPQNNPLMSMMSQIINNPGMQELMPRLRSMISEGDMANISSQMQNVMQNPEVWNNLDSLLNMGGAGGSATGNPNPNPENPDHGPH